MNAFERELVKAIEHGCPECRHSGVKTHVEITEERTVSLRGSRTFISNNTTITKRTTDIECSLCMAMLWDSESGWIPELAEIVKGE